MVKPSPSMGFRCQVSDFSPAADQKIGWSNEKETEVSNDLHGISLRAQGVCIRFNLILFVLVLVLVLVLGDQNFIEDEDDWSTFDFAA